MAENPAVSNPGPADTGGAGPAAPGGLTRRHRAVRSPGMACGCC